MVLLSDGDRLVSVTYVWLTDHHIEPIYVVIATIVSLLVTLMFAYRVNYLRSRRKI